MSRISNIARDIAYLVDYLAMVEEAEKITPEDDEDAWFQLGISRHAVEGELADRFGITVPAAA